MNLKWQDAFSQVPDFKWKNPQELQDGMELRDLHSLKTFLDWVHIKTCLIRPFEEEENYPLVETRALLPSFELDVYEYHNLPGFILVALDRPINYFAEVFQFDRLHDVVETPANAKGASCALDQNVNEHNMRTIRSRIPKHSHDEFLEKMCGSNICALEHYPLLLDFLLQMDRAHIMAKESNGLYHLAGVYGSLPSDLDHEIKSFGLRIGKFSPGDNARYERNRLFVYQYLMELYGFPIVSERRTATSMFGRRLFRKGERFLVRVMGQSDRTLTTLWSHPKAKLYPRVEKIALVEVDKYQKDALARLEEGGFLVDTKRRAAILRVIYKQHKFNTSNVREDRALSVLRQEIIHPLTGEVITDINLVKDTSNMIFALNDIVRGEFQGAINYKRQEVVHDTSTHENRLKFLYSWLSKHQRRIIGYSDEFYSGVVKVLDSYLLNPENIELFYDMNDLYQEVWAKYSYIQQARKVQLLEYLQHRIYKGVKISYQAQFRIMVDTLNELKFEIVNYFDELVENVLQIGDNILNEAYLLRKYIRVPDEKLTQYGRELKELYGQVVSLLEEFAAIRKSRRETTTAYELNRMF